MAQPDILIIGRGAVSINWMRHRLLDTASGLAPLLKGLPSLTVGNTYTTTRTHFSRTGVTRNALS